MTWNVGTPKKKENKENETRVQNSIDGGWGWLVTFASCIGISFSWSFSSAFGFIYSSLVEEFGFELTSLTIIGSIHTALSLTGAVLVVPFVEKFGSRLIVIIGGLLMFIGCLVAAFSRSFLTLLISMGVVMGAGSGMIFVTCTMAVNMYFDKKKPIAMTIVSIGASLSVVIFCPTVKYLLETYGNQGCMIIMSGLLLNVVVCGAVIFPINSPGQETTERKTENIDMSFCKEIGFIMYLLANFIYIAGYFIPIGLLPDTAKSEGVNLDNISITFTINGFTQLVGRFIFGFMSHKLPTQITRLWIVFLFADAATMLIVPFSTNLYHFLAFNIINGFFMGGTNLGYNLALKNITEPKYYGRAISLALLMQGCGSLVGNPLAAFLKKVTGNKGMPYFFATAMFVIAALILIPYSKAKKPKATDILIAVSDNNFTVHIQKNSQKDMDKNGNYELDIELFGYSYI